MKPEGTEGLFPEVSRETWEKLDELAALVSKWQRAVNLVSSSSLPALWQRHILDSLQLSRLARDARSWVDLGSGGGFPGLVVAASRPALAVHMVESDQRKAAFLREASRHLELATLVHCQRIEHFAGRDDLTGFDVVSARALASLPHLLDLAYPLLKKGAVGVFPKGKGLDHELTEAHKSWMFQHEIVPSMTSADGGILVIHGAEPRDRKPSHD